MQNNGDIAITGLSIIVKIILSIISIFITFIAWIIIGWICLIDNVYLSIIFNLGFISIFVLFILLIWMKRNKGMISIIIGGVMLFLFVNLIYYNFYSVRIEPLIYLHNKYNYSYNDMKIEKTTMYSRPFICISYCDGTPRSATVSYHKTKIYVHYKNKWVDNLAEIMQYKRNDEDIIKSFNSILKHYSNNFKIIHDIANDGYGYDIILHINDANNLGNIIYEADNYINEKADSSNGNLYIEYSIYVIKDNNLYDKIVKNCDNLPNVKLDYDGQAFATDIIPIITELQETMITKSAGYNPNIFLNNGDISDDKFQPVSLFKHIIFFYGSTPNATLFGQSFNVFGLN